MKKFTLAALASLSLMLGVNAPANAQISYVTAAGTSSKFSGADFDETGYGVRYGAQLHKNFALEIGYDNFGKADYTITGVPFAIKATGVSLAMVARYELIPNLYVRGSLGRIRVHQKVSPGTDEDQPEDVAKGIYGLGAEQSFGKHFSLFGELRQARFEGVKLRQLNAGLKLNF